MKKKNNNKESNNKAEAARVRKIATVAERNERESKSKEDQYWREAEGAKSRAAKKREEEAEKRAELAAKKAEARRLAELEEKELSRYVKKPDLTARVTEAELLRRKEEEQAAIRRKAEEDKKKTSRIVDETEYERIVSMPNVNRGGERIEATTVDDAIVQMTQSALVMEKNPEKRRKALFMAFQEAELPVLKLEKPGLTQNQYKDMVWKMWKKSLDNPENQAKSTSAKLSSGPVISDRMDNFLLMKVELNEALVKKGVVVSHETDQVSGETGDVGVDQALDEADECCARAQVTLADYLFRNK